jgi:hypothetical protein
MEYSEILQRVVGILTKSAEWKRLLEEDADRTDIASEAPVIGPLLDGILPNLVLPADATVDQLGPLISEQIMAGLMPLVGAFTEAHHALAEVHDAGRTDVSSAEVLQNLVLLHIGTNGRDL